MINQRTRLVEKIHLHVSVFFSTSRFLLLLRAIALFLAILMSPYSKNYSDTSSPSVQPPRDHELSTLPDSSRRMLNTRRLTPQTRRTLSTSWPMG